MKKFLRALSLLLVVTLIGAVLAWRAGWLHLPPPAPPEPPPSPAAEASPSPIAQASPSPPMQSSPSPLPHRDPRVLRVAVGDRASALLFLALPRFIREHQNDIDLQCVIVPNATLRWQLLAAGRVDLACGTLDSFVLAAGRNNPGVLLFEIGSSNGLDALVARNAASLPDLAGKPIAVVGGEGGRRLLAYFLSSAKMLLSEIAFIEADDASDALQLLRTGRVDGAVLWSPYLESALKEPGMHVIARTSTTLLQPVEVCVVSHASLANRKAQIINLMRSWFELERLMQHDHSLGTEIVARYAERRASEVAAHLELVRLYTLKENQQLDQKTIATEIGALQDFWRVSNLPNSNGRIDAERLVQVDLTRQVDLDASSATPPPVSTPDDTSASPDIEATPAAIDASSTPAAIDASSTPVEAEPSTAPQLANPSASREVAPSPR